MAVALLPSQQETRTVNYKTLLILDCPAHSPQALKSLLTSD